jgi:2-succinyl-6-hydroxy-2,4-cyclohexadiene-1-carboxylate synthase
MEPQIVLLHGFSHTGASWDPVKAALPERYRALAPDIRGHGQASEARPVTLEAVVRDLAEQTPERFTVVGYSMGGRIALHAALHLENRICGLVLVGASPGIADPVERRARRHADERLAREMEDARIEEFAARWAQTPILSGQPPEVAAAAHADRLRNTSAGLASALRGLGTGALPSLWGRLGALGSPVTLIVGERDHKFREIAARMAEELAKAEIVVVPEGGHAVHLEAPERVAEIIAGRTDRWLKVSGHDPMTAP